MSVIRWFWELSRRCLCVPSTSWHLPATRFDHKKSEEEHLNFSKNPKLSKSIKNSQSYGKISVIRWSQNISQIPLLKLVKKIYLKSRRILPNPFKNHGFGVNSVKILINSISANFQYFFMKFFVKNRYEFSL